jgi:VanZ family protein
MALKTIARYLWYWSPPVILMTTIFYLSSQPRFSVAEDEGLNFLVFKTLHMVEYAILYFSLFRAFHLSRFKKLDDSHVLWIPAIIAILYGASDEFHQTLVPTRSGTIRDVLIDTAGILIAVMYTKRYRGFIRKYLF